MKNARNQERLVAQLSRDAGRRAFDQIVRQVNLAALETIGCLDEQERTWTRLISFRNHDDVYAQALEDWEREAKYEREAFAAGFFERAQQHWNLQTEEYDGLDGSGRQDDSSYKSHPQVVPMSIELFKIVECWARFLLDDDWTFFLAECAGDWRDRRLAEWRFRQIAKLVGNDRVEATIKKVHDRQAKSTPTLWRIFREGTKEEWELVRKLVERLFYTEPWKEKLHLCNCTHCCGLDLEEAVKAELEKASVSAQGGQVSE